MWLVQFPASMDASEIKFSPFFFRVLMTGITERAPTQSFNLEKPWHGCLLGPRAKMQKGRMIRWASALCIGACASSFTTSQWRARGSGQRIGASRLAMLALKSGRGAYYILCLFFKCLKSSRWALIVILARFVFCGMLTCLKDLNRDASFSMARPFSY